MAKKVFTEESLATLVDETKAYTDNAVSTKANSSHTHTIANVTNLQTILDGKAASSHIHSISNVTGLQDELDTINEYIVAISDDEIDTICGSTLQAAREVTY